MNLFFEIAKASGLSGVAFTVTVGAAAVFLAIKEVFNLASGNRLLFSPWEHDHRTMERIRELKDLDDGHFAIIFERERFLLERDLCIRDSKKQFRKYVKSKKEVAVWTGQVQNQFKMRGPAQFAFYVFASAFLVSAVLLLVIIAFSYVLIAINQKSQQKTVDVNSLIPLFLLGCGFLVAGGALIVLVQWAWNRALIGYAYRKYIRLPLIEKTNTIFDAGNQCSVSSDQIDYDAAFNLFEKEMHELGNKQIKLPAWAGVLTGSFLPVGIAAAAFNALNYVDCAKIVNGLGSIVFLIGIVLAAISLNKSDKIPPYCPIVQAKKDDNAAMPPIPKPSITEPQESVQR